MSMEGDMIADSVENSLIASLPSLLVNDKSARNTFLVEFEKRGYIVVSAAAQREVGRLVEQLNRRIKHLEREESERHVHYHCPSGSVLHAIGNVVTIKPWVLKDSTT